MAQRRSRGGRVKQKEEKSRLQRQADFLTLQIILVLLLLGAFWGTKRLFPGVYAQLSRLGAVVLEGDEAVESALLSPDVWEQTLLDRFGIDVGSLWGRLWPRRLRAPADLVGAEPESPEPEDSAAETEPDEAGGGPGGRGGVSAVSAAYPQTPRGVTLAPLLLSAKPRVPVAGNVTSFFGWRDNPLSPGSWDFHTGLDIAAAEGSVIRAALPGTVADVGQSDSYGNYILVHHEGGLSTFYCHCSQVVAQTGEVIRAGERIALVGQTGRVTGPHLHFEIRSQTLSSDPLPQLI